MVKVIKRIVIYINELYYVNVRMLKIMKDLMEMGLSQI